MIDLELELLTEDTVSYRYYPEGGEEYGIVSLNRKTGERILDLPCHNSISMYANHAWRLLEKYQISGKRLDYVVLGLSLP